MQMVNCTKAETHAEMYMTRFLRLARFEVPMAVIVSIAVFWDVAPFTGVDIYLCVQEHATSQKIVILLQYEPHLCVHNYIAQAVTSYCRG
jgi:hypothetical protein